MREDVVEPVDLSRYGLVSQPQEDDTGVGELAVVDQFAKVFVIRDDDTLLGVGDRQDLVIFDRKRVVTDNRGNIMTELLQVGGERKVSTLVEQELNTPLTGAGSSSRAADLARWRRTLASANSRQALTSCSVSRG